MYKFTDEDSINIEFAEKIAGWKNIYFEEGENVDIDAREIYPWRGMAGTPPEGGKRRLIPAFTEWADHVLPILEKWDQHFELTHHSGLWHMYLEDNAGFMYCAIKEKTLAMTIVKGMLLRHAQR